MKGAARRGETASGGSGLEGGEALITGVPGRPPPSSSSSSHHCEQRWTSPHRHPQSSSSARGFPSEGEGEELPARGPPRREGQGSDSDDGESEPLHGLHAHRHGRVPAAPLPSPPPPPGSNLRQSTMSCQRKHVEYDEGNLRQTHPEFSKRRRPSESGRYPGHPDKRAPDHGCGGWQGSTSPDPVAKSPPPQTPRQVLHCELLGKGINGGYHRSKGGVPSPRRVQGGSQAPSQKRLVCCRSPH